VAERHDAQVHFATGIGGRGLKVEVEFAGAKPAPGSLRAAA
jgi:hypothetical protein